jgi:hypothetical protein
LQHGVNAAQISSISLAINGMILDVFNTRRSGQTMKS